MKLKSINPYSLETIGEYDVYSASRIEGIINAAYEGYLTHKERSIVQRSVLMQKVSEALLLHKEEYATMITEEMGKVFKEAVAEIEKCAWVCDYYAQNAEDFLMPVEKESDYSKSYVSYQPMGVVLAVMPWNFPFWQVFRFAAPTLMAGNSAILKHASNVSGCALMIERVFAQAGLGDVFKTVLCPSSAVKSIIDNDKIKATSLTGSEYAGSQVAKCSGEQIKKSVLELGGSDPFVVWEDADLDKAVKEGIVSRFLNAAQSCIGAKRFILCDKVYDRFKALFLEELVKLKTGDPKESTTLLAPLAGVSHADTLAHQIEKAIECGADLIGGKRINETTFEAGVLENISANNPIRTVELFGPIAQFYKVSSIEECIALCNETPFGLGSAVWTNDSSMQEYFIQNIEAGAVFINSMVKSDPRLPFGGIKRSGFGRELAEEGIKEFVNHKTVVIA